METIDVSKLLHDPENYFSHYFLGVCELKELVKLEKANELNLEKLEIDIKVNGITISFDKFEKFLKYCVQSYKSDLQQKIKNVERHINEKAKELLEEKTGDLIDKLNNLGYDLDDICLNVRETAGWEYIDEKAFDEISDTTEDK